MDEMTTHFNILLFLEVVIHSNLKKRNIELIVLKSKFLHMHCHTMHRAFHKFEITCSG